jgi:hypothetical protein
VRLHDRCAQSAARGVDGNTQAGGTSTDHKQIECFAGQSLQMCSARLLAGASRLPDPFDRFR